MATATMTSKGQMTVPKSIRELLQIGAGDRVQFVVNEQGEVVVRPARGEVRALRGLLAVPRSRKAVSVEDMNDAILVSHSSRR